jgi:hypothetical protein
MLDDTRLIHDDTLDRFRSIFGDLAVPYGLLGHLAARYSSTRTYGVQHTYCGVRLDPCLISYEIIFQLLPHSSRCPWYFLHSKVSKILHHIRTIRLNTSRPRPIARGRVWLPQRLSLPSLSRSPDAQIVHSRLPKTATVPTWPKGLSGHRPDYHEHVLLGKIRCSWGYSRVFGYVRRLW